MLFEEIAIAIIIYNNTITILKYDSISKCLLKEVLLNTGKRLFLNKNYMIPTKNGFLFDLIFDLFLSSWAAKKIGPMSLKYEREGSWGFGNRWK